MQDPPHELVPPIAEVGADEDQSGDQIGTTACSDGRRGGRHRGAYQDRRTSAKRLNYAQQVGCGRFVTVAVEVCRAVAMAAKINTGDAKSGGP